MSQLFYLGNGHRHESRPETDTRSQNRYRSPKDYIAEPGLVNAVNVALLLAKPLLLTGEPGTGKSQLAYSLAWELGFKEPLKFETKSTSTARDLFYTFDTVSRFKAMHDQDTRVFLTYNALGKAILFANDEVAVSKYLTPQMVHGGKRRSVVLIDEVDKAPRDFPNDILNELEYLHFWFRNLETIRYPSMTNIVLLSLLPATQKETFRTLSCVAASTTICRSRTMTHSRRS